MKIEQSKGIILIAIGLCFLMGNGWVTIRLLTLVLGLLFINYGLIKLGSPSLVDFFKNVFSALKF